MKAVLGMLFILGGVTVGWLVLSGKFPNANAGGPATPIPGANGAGGNFGSNSSVTPIPGANGAGGNFASLPYRPPTQGGFTLV